MSVPLILVRPTALLFLIAATACGISIGDPGVRGSGRRIAQTRALGDFDRVQIAGQFDVRITSGASPSLRVEGDDNLLPLVKTRIVDGTLRVRSERPLRPDRRILVEIGTPALVGVETSGSGDVSLSVSEALDASTGGSGEVRYSGRPVVNASVSGSGEVEPI